MGTWEHMAGSGRRLCTALPHARSARGACGRLLSSTGSLGLENSLAVVTLWALAMFSSSYAMPVMAGTLGG